MYLLGKRIAFASFVLVLVILPLTIAACGQDKPTSTPVPPTSPPPTADLPAFEPADCRFQIPPGYQVECGDLVTLERHNQPDGPVVRLHVAIFKSTNPNPAADPVVHLVGGPGGSLLDSANFYLQAGGLDILQSRDYVLFNQRGTQYSTPWLDCPGRTEFNWQLAGEGLSDAEKQERDRAWLLDCHDNLMGQQIDLGAYHSAENAADVNDLRLALGYERINLYGISYGTRLALTVMRDYPEGIRSVILDSVYPPQVGLFSHLAPNAHRAFSVLFQDCAADPACNQNYPNLEATFYQTYDALEAKPAKIKLEQGSVWVDGDFFIDTIFGSMYRTDVLQWVPAMIYGASQGNLASMALALEANLDAEGLSTGMHYAVQCREELSFESLEEVTSLAADLPKQLQAHYVSPFNFDLCQSWQSGVADPIENEPVASDIPALVLSGQYDPITPPAWGQLAAESLSHSFFYQFPGVGHGVIRSNPCGRQIGLQFLDDPISKPDTSCIDQLGPPDFQ